MKKRSLIALLACMTLSAGAGVATIAVENAPFTAITADAATTDVVTALETGGNVTLESDLELSKTVLITKDTVLDLNGFKVTAAAAWNDGDSLLTVNYGAKLTVKDSSDEENGAIIAANNGKLLCAIKMTNTGTTPATAEEVAALVVESGTVQGYYYAISGNGYRNGTVVTVEGGNVLADKTEGVAIYQPQVGDIYVNGGYIEAATGVEARNGSLVVQGGTIVGNGTLDVTESNNGATVTGAAIAVSDHSTEGNPSVIILNGEIKGVNGANSLYETDTTEDNDGYQGNYLQIMGGEFTGAVKATSYTEPNEVFIAGGTFNTDVTDYVASGFGLEYDAVTGVTAAKVAEVGGVAYTSLAAAVDAAASGATVTITNNLTLIKTVTISKKLTLNLNGKEILGAVEDGYGMLYVGTKGDLTITGDGKLTNTSGYAIGNYGKVTVESGTITGTYALYNFNYNGTLYGTATINGGTFDTNATEEGLAIANSGVLEINDGTFNATVDSTAKMTVNGGAFEEVLVKDPDYVTGVGSATEINGGTIASLKVITDTNKEASNSLTLDETNTTVTNMNAAAKVDGVYYGTLQAAIDAANENDTIELLSDITVDETIVINKNLTIEGNGKTITSTMTATDNRIIDIPKTVANANVTLKNLNIVGSGDGNYSRGVNYNSNGTLTLDKVSISNVKYYAVNLPMSASSGATINVVDSEISGWAAINVWGVGVTVNVTDSTLESVWFDKNWNFGAIVLNNKNCKVNLTRTSFKKTGDVGGYSDIVLEEKTTEGTSASNTSITLSDTDATIDAVATVNGVYYGSFETAYNAANAGDTIKLAGDLTLTKRLEIDKEITLDLGNYAISGAVEDVFGMIYVKKTGNLTVKGNGVITNTADIAIGNYGEVTIESGTITGTYALYNFNHNGGELKGTATINGGTFNTNAATGGLAIANSGVLEINDGKFNATVDTTAKITVNGGTFEELLVKDPDYVTGVGSATEINGGKIASLRVIADTENSVEITGGTFDTDVTEYCAEGFAPVYDATAGTYTVYTEDQAGIVELEKKVAELTESLEAKAEEIKALQTALATLQTTVGGNSTTITNLQADLAAKATELANLQTALNNLDGEVTDNTAKITTITSDVANLNAELATLVGTTLPALKDELKALIDTNASEISSLKTALATLQTTVGNNSTTITNLQADLVAKAKELANLQTALNNLDGEVTDNTAKITTITSDVANLNAELATLVGTTLPALKDELKALIDTNAGNITTLEKALEALGKDVDTNTDTIADVKAALDALTADTAKDIKDLSDKINKINDSIAVLTSNVSTLQSKVDKEIADRKAAINSLRTELDSKITANATDIEALEKALKDQASANEDTVSALKGELEGKIAANAADIAALQEALDAQVATLTASIKALDAKAEEYAETLAEIAEWQTTYAAKVEANEKAIKTLQTDLDAAEAKIANLEKLQADLQKKVTEIEALQTALSATVTSNGEAIEALQTALNEKVTELKGLLTEVNAEIDGNTAAISSLKAAVEAEIATIEAWQTAFDAKVAANKAEIEKLQSQVSTLEEQVEALDSDNSVLLAVTIIAIAFSLTSLAVSSIMWVKKLEQKEEKVEDKE